MHEGINLLAELYPRCFCRTNRRPLKVGIYEEVISRHPEMSKPQIKRLLKEYTQSPEYWSTLAAGTPRIDLAGGVAGEVTAADEEDAKRKIAKGARRVAAEAIEDRNAAGRPSAKPVAERAGQQNAIQETLTPSGPPRVGLAGLKAAGQARRARLVTAE
jgi:sRNA-binding protein